ncbi:MAG: thiol:disulfide interchange protein DsbA/DsbL [Betaproteobacteria bacterium]|nr:thiol:disulfide interchange protein DsbA/DsbL [Betaproteobacteria bacterium]
MKWLRFAVALFIFFPALVSAQPRPGVDYGELKPAQPAESAGKVEILEFFWYGCPHCYTLEPALENWVKKLPPDTDFKRVPAVLSANWEPHARIYYAFEALGVLEKLHRPFFDAIHRDHLSVANEAAVNQWLAKNGVDAKKFADTTRSFGVSSKVKRAAQLSAAYRVDGVPMIAVQGRYTVNAEQGGSQQGMLDVTSFLIGQSRKDLKQPARK